MKIAGFVQIICLMIFFFFFLSSTFSCEQMGLPWMRFSNGSPISSTFHSTHHWPKGDDDDDDDCDDDDGDEVNDDDDDGHDDDDSNDQQDPGRQWSPVE